MRPDAVASRPRPAHRPRMLGGHGAPPRQRRGARRFLVRRHLLAPPRSLPAGLDGVRAAFERLGSIQFDPLAVAGRNHDLVLHARVRDYDPAWTNELLYERRELFETYNKMLSLLPTSELPWFRLAWDRFLAEHRDGAFARHRRDGRARPRAPPGRGAPVQPRLRASAPRSTGTGDPPARCAPSSRRSRRPASSASPGARATAATSTSSSASSRPSCWPTGPTSASSSATSCSRATAPTACSARAARPSSGTASPRPARRRTTRRGPRPARRCARSSWPRASCVPVAVEGVRGTRYVLGDGGRPAARGRGGGRPGTPLAGRRASSFLAPLDSLRLGPRPAAQPLRLRLRLGGLRAAGEAPLGLLRPAAPLRRPARGPHRAAHRPGRAARCASWAPGGSRASGRATRRASCRPCGGAGRLPALRRGAAGSSGRPTWGRSDGSSASARARPEGGLAAPAGPTSGAGCAAVAR